MIRSRVEEVITVSSHATPWFRQSVVSDSGFVIAADLVSYASGSYFNMFWYRLRTQYRLLISVKMVDLLCFVVRPVDQVHWIQLTQKRSILFSEIWPPTLLALVVPFHKKHLGFCPLYRELWLVSTVLAMAILRLTFHVRICWWAPS